MEKLISKFFDKISKYEIITNLIPGALLTYILSIIGYKVFFSNVFLDILVCYYVGIVNNRFSSLCIEELMRYKKWVKWREYDQYNKAKEKRAFIASLQQSANQFRAFAAVFILSLLAFFFKLLQDNCEFFDKYGYLFIIVALFFLFFFSYRKQINDYVVKNIDEVNNIEKEQ